jgi:hypothetical protein
LEKRKWKREKMERRDGSFLAAKERKRTQKEKLKMEINPKSNAKQEHQNRT